MKATAKDYLLLHFLVLIWGFTAIIGLLISLPAVEIVFYRTLISVAGLGFLLLARNRNFRLGKSTIIKVFFTGFLISAHWILFFASARISTASVCLAGLSTIALWTSILEPLMTKRKFHLYEIALGLVVIIGLYIIFRFQFNHALGLIMGIASALFASLFTVINAKLSTHYNPYMLNFYEMIGAFVSTVLFLPFYAYVFQNGELQMIPTLSDWFYLSILALVCTVYAYSASIELMKRISAFAMNLTVNLEPVYGIILAFFIFREKEKMSIEFYFGTAIIILTVLAYPVINNYYRRKPMAIDNLR